MSNIVSSFLRQCDFYNTHQWKRINDTTYKYKDRYNNRYTVYFVIDDERNKIASIGIKEHGDDCVQCVDVDSFMSNFELLLY